jgi:hypothetical protein
MRSWACFSCFSSGNAVLSMLSCFCSGNAVLSMYAIIQEMQSWASTHYSRKCCPDSWASMHYFRKCCPEPVLSIQKKLTLAMNYECGFVSSNFAFVQCTALNDAKQFFLNIFLGDIFFFSYCIQHCFICRPSDSTVPTNAGIEPRTVATGALAVRHSNH